MKTKIGIPILIGLIASGWAAPALGSVVYSGSLGLLSAQAEFDVSGTNLVVKLTNTSLNDVTIPSEVLTGVYFDIAGTPVALTSVSAVLNVGSSVLFGVSDPGGVVGGEWGFRQGLSGAPGSASNGISSAGLGLFSGTTFPGTNLDPPVALDGINYGITSVGDNPATGNSAVTGDSPLIKNAVVFTLGGLPANFDLLRIQNVHVQYGTSLTEPSYSIPSPGASTLLLAGLGFLARHRRR